MGRAALPVRTKDAFGRSTPDDEHCSGRGRRRTRLAAMMRRQRRKETKVRSTYNETASHYAAHDAGVLEVESAVERTHCCAVERTLC